MLILLKVNVGFFKPLESLTAHIEAKLHMGYFTYSSLLSAHMPKLVASFDGLLRCRQGRI